MKKLLIVFILLYICSFLFACDTKKSESEEESNISSVSSSVVQSQNTTPSSSDSKDNPEGSVKDEDINHGDLAMIVSETYDDYLRFLDADHSIENFVTYEALKSFGEFGLFACYGFATNSMGSYFYKLNISDGLDIYLFVNHREEKQEVPDVKAEVNVSDLRTAKTGGKSAAYESDGIIYHYLANGNLSRICWNTGGVWFELQGELNKCPLSVNEKSIVASLFSKDSAKSTLDTIFGNYRAESKTVNSYETYLSLIQSAKLTDGFVGYDDISFIGEFVEFTVYGSSLEECKKYKYVLENDNERFTLEVEHTKNEPCSVNLFEKNVELTAMGYIDKEDSLTNGVFEKNGIRYNYIHRFLQTIIWYTSDIKFKLYETNSIQFMPKEQSFAFKLLNANVAEEMLNNRIIK